MIFKKKLKKVPESVTGEKICAKKCINRNLSGTNTGVRKGPLHIYETLIHLTTIKLSSSKKVKIYIIKEIKMYFYYI